MRITWRNLCFSINYTNSTQIIFDNAHNTQYDIIKVEEAVEMGIDAASGWIPGELEDGRKVPEAAPYERVSAEDGGMVNMILLDMDSYAENMGIKQ